MGQGLEGGTKAHRNPNVKPSLGLQRFYDLYQGWSLLSDRDVCQPSNPLEERRVVKAQG